MIKLIATDLDGTFLDSKKNKPADFPEVFKEIKRRGITFAAASGRDYNGAAMYFKDYIDDMYFICDNGASLYKNDLIDLIHNAYRKLYSKGIMAEGLAEIKNTLEITKEIQYIIDFVESSKRGIIR